MSAAPLKILVATDDSSHASKALEMAARLARQGSGELAVVSVVNLPARLAASSGANTGWGDVVMESLEALYGQALAHAQEKLLSAEPGLKVETLLRWGNPGDVICEEAARGGFDLVVLGSRGQSEIKSHFLGSVSDRVMHHAPCSVLIVR